MVNPEHQRSWSSSERRPTTRSSKRCDPTGERSCRPRCPTRRSSPRLKILPGEDPKAATWEQSAWAGAREPEGRRSTRRWTEPPGRRVAETNSWPLDHVLTGLSRLADHGYLWIVLAAALSATGNRRARRGVGGMAAASTAANVIGKGAARRRRPDVGVPVLRRLRRVPRTSSFPVRPRCVRGGSGRRRGSGDYSRCARPAIAFASAVGASRVAAGCTTRRMSWPGQPWGRGRAGDVALVATAADPACHGYQAAAESAGLGGPGGPGARRQHVDIYGLGQADRQAGRGSARLPGWSGPERSPQASRRSLSN